MSFTLAIVGRPNVGKSTLFNRLTGKRQALVDDSPGVTRDVRGGKAQLGILEFDIIDTAGLEDAAKETLQYRMSKQTRLAMDNADVLLFMVDGRAGITPQDEEIAAQVRKGHKNILLVVNKAEANKTQSAVGDAYRLGLGEPIAISSEHGEGMDELHDALLKFSEEKKEEDDEENKKEDVIQLFYCWSSECWKIHFI